MLNFCDFIQVHVFTTNHHLKGCQNNKGILIELCMNDAHLVFGISELK